jgi:kinesin family protein C1
MDAEQRNHWLSQRATIDPFSCSSLSGPFSRIRSEMISLSSSPSPEESKERSITQSEVRTTYFFSEGDDEVEATPIAKRHRPQTDLSVVSEANSAEEHLPTTPKVRGLPLHSAWSIRKIRKVADLEKGAERPSSGFKNKIFGQLEELNHNLHLLGGHKKTSSEKLNCINRNSPRSRNSLNLTSTPPEKAFASAKHLNSAQSNMESRSSNEEASTKGSNQAAKERLKQVESDLRDKQLTLMKNKGAQIALVKELEEKEAEYENIEKQILAEIENLQKEQKELENILSYNELSLKKHRSKEEETRKQLEDKQSMINFMQQQLKISEERRANLMQALHSLKGSLQIYCKIKPLTDSSEARWVYQHDFCPLELCIKEPGRVMPLGFMFDGICGENCTTNDLFQKLQSDILGILDGKNVSIFCLGPANSGRQETYLGTSSEVTSYFSSSAKMESWGIVQYSLESIVKETAKKNTLSMSSIGQELEVHLSCLEVLDEKLGDLLSNDREKEIEITVNKGKIFLPGVVKKKITSMREALDTIRISSERRQTEATAYNSRSSRSHSIYRISISKRGANGEQLGLLNIIDMAGSEKNSLDTQDTDSKKALSTINSEKLKKIQKEANYINKSLTTLGRIVRLIKHQRTMGIKDLCIPYRESKLTRMLQDCIGGEAQTLLIVNINPSAKCVGQTKETLNFASVACV